MNENIETLLDVSPPTPGEEPEESPQLSAAEQDTVRELVHQARANGSALTSPGGVLKQLTKMVVEVALDEEMNEHLGYEPGDPQGRNRGNSLKGKRAKMVITDNAGPVQIEVPRDRAGSFEPVIVKKRQRRLSELHQVVLSLSAKGSTSGEISAHLGEVYGAEVSKDTVRRFTDRNRHLQIHAGRGTCRWPIDDKLWELLEPLLFHPRLIPGGTVGLLAP